MDKLPQIIQSSSISSKSPPTLDLLENLSCSLYQRDQQKPRQLLADILAYSGTALFDLGLDIDPRDNNRLLGVRLGGFGFKVPSRIIITTFLLQTHSQCHRPHHYFTTNSTKIFTIITSTLIMMIYSTMISTMIIFSTMISTIITATLTMMI